MKKFWSIFLGILLVSACEYNPFFGKEKIPERKITGKISLEFSEDPGHVYVWLENTDLITQSLADGSFTMPLPTPGEAGAGTIVSGSYKLYFYSANYQLVSIPLEFFNGEIVADQVYINKYGELKKGVNLKNILTIDSKVSQILNDSGAIDSIKVKVTLVPNETNVFIKTIVKVGAKGFIIRTGYLIFNDEQKLVKSINLEKSLLRVEAVMSPQKEWTAKFPLDQSMISKGEYEIIPYILVDRSDVPEKMESFIGSNYKLFDQNFILYPLKRTGGKLVIQ